MAPFTHRGQRRSRRELPRRRLDFRGAALLFTGPLTPFVGHALGWAVLATLAHLLVLARLCTLPGTLATAQSIPIAVLAAAMGAAVHAVTAQGAAARPGALLGTAAATLVIGSALIGAVLVLLGRAGAGRLARFLPYPVLVGVMASSGWLLAVGALRLLRAPVADAAAAAASGHGLVALGASAWALLMLLGASPPSSSLDDALVAGPGSTAAPRRGVVVGLVACRSRARRLAARRARRGTGHGLAGSRLPRPAWSAPIESRPGWRGH